ncbi:hypothetical protein GJ744_009675 [Endocarpon pusillum]|uniref:NACHT domain-containing protein n=1 Tax=Endocarpon pusillum TaxID=364733 RepID=A0A8H7E4R0_9EURO|nr:hypothetical protein GJ744_009675 [Endocarpon pusillum]
MDVARYSIGWIAPLPLELTAAKAVLDEDYGDIHVDGYIYHGGRLGQHNIVMAVQPKMGNDAASDLAARMRAAFKNIEYFVVVGIGGGVPSYGPSGAPSEIVLGDVVVSYPRGSYGGVVRYDFGAWINEGQLEFRWHMNGPPDTLLNAVNVLQARHSMGSGTKIPTFLPGMRLKIHVPERQKFKDPGAEQDRLFQKDSFHPKESLNEDCKKYCDLSRSQMRHCRGIEAVRQADTPKIHYGNIASSNQLQISAHKRDQLHEELGVICFEMEGAGVIHKHPCLVIRGICDYSDSHKNKQWQPYAAATAAAYTKELLETMPASNYKDKDNDKDREDVQCLKDLQSTNPRDDKTRIERSKDDLLKESYMWILEDPAFRDWCHDDNTQLLWIKGNPGKGKTMLMMGLINELSKQLESTPGSGILSYFFCQATEPTLNNAISVIKALIFLLADQRRPLIRHLRKRYDISGRPLFEGSNAFFALSAILSDMLHDASLARVYLMVDALDECNSGLSQLLDFIARNTSEPSKVKWLVSSRNRPDIEERLRPAGSRTKISLELNSSHISRAVNAFIDFRILKLTELKRYKAEVQKKIRKYLYEKADGTFLWVALVCKALHGVRVGNTLSALEKFPPGLQPLYERMMEQIRCLEDSDDVESCTRILSSATLAYRPIHLKELVAMAGLQEDPNDVESLNELVDLCGSFLTIREDTVYFIHQSAKDYFSTGKGAQIFASGQAEEHREMALRALQVMNDGLKRDMCKLRVPGALLDEVHDINQDCLAYLRYACCYWVSHLRDAGHLLHEKLDLYDNGTIHMFLIKHFLHWLEALSLIGSISDGVIMIRTLKELLIRKSDKAELLLAMIQDAKRFILYNRWIIEKAPLQVYTSALVFAPKKSIIRKQFSSLGPSWITTGPATDENWSQCLQTLEGHSGPIYSVTFSADSRRLASASSDRTVRLWDSETGALQQTLEGHSKSVNSVAFSADGRRLASASYDSTVRLWDSETGALQQTLEGHSKSVNSVAFSADGRRLASASDDSTVRLWDSETGALQQTLEGHSSLVNSVAFSADGRRLASASDDSTVRLWDSETGVLQQTLEGHSGPIYSVAFSADGRRLASASYNSTVRLWDSETGVLQQTLEGHSKSVNSVAFSADGRWLASVSYDNTVRLWDGETGALQQTLEIGSFLDQLSFSPDGLHLITALGVISLHHSPSAITQTPTWSGYFVRADRSWVTANGAGILWIPPEYRPTCSVVRKQTIVIGCASGRVLIMKFDPQLPLV